MERLSPLASCGEHSRDHPVLEAFHGGSPGQKAVSPSPVHRVPLTQHQPPSQGWGGGPACLLFNSETIHSSASPSQPPMLPGSPSCQHPDCPDCSPDIGFLLPGVPSHPHMQPVLQGQLQTPTPEPVCAAKASVSLPMGCGTAELWGSPTCLCPFSLWQKKTSPWAHTYCSHPSPAVVQKYRCALIDRGCMDPLLASPLHAGRLWVCSFIYPDCQLKRRPGQGASPHLSPKVSGRASPSGDTWRALTPGRVKLSGLLWQEKQAHSSSGLQPWGRSRAGSD